MTKRILTILATLASVAVAWFLGLVVYASDIPRTVADPKSPTDVIVVLTGGSERLKEGFRLLAKKQARKLFVSGVYRGVEVKELLGLSRAAPEDILCCVVLGHVAGDTQGNATDHMPRSLFEFQQVMPKIKIIPHPVFPKNVRRDQWWRYLGTSRLYAGEFNKYLVARLRVLVLAQEPPMPRPQ